MIARVQEEKAAPICKHCAGSGKVKVRGKKGPCPMCAGTGKAGIRTK